ncbi:Crp/Fnr family transcriptional regulator [Rhizobium leguminosarum]|uniref:Crp/Fnr family transcriptional regulator n=1 Tax=Rhizobium leguminosarum TaxID=384 RepID=UPI0021BC25DB|nr:Crp/Fnr family transcriptional regulator [Rhizobium leguminosarum]
MSDPLIDHFLELSTGKATFAVGQHIFNQGDAITWLHLMQAGTVHLVRHQADGNVAILQRASPGTVIAEASVFSSRYHCDALAVTASEALIIPVNSVRRLLRSDCVFAETWASYLSHQLQQARKRAEIASLKTVAARLNAWLAWNDGLLPPKGEWKNLANEIGVSPEALYRELAKGGKFFFA